MNGMDYDQYEKDIQMTIDKYQEELVRLNKHRKDNNDNNSSNGINDSNYEVLLKDKDNQINRLREVIHRFELENIVLKQSNAIQNQQLMSYEAKLKLEQHSEELMKSITQLTNWNKEMHKSIESTSNASLKDKNIIKSIEDLIQCKMPLLLKSALIHYNDPSISIENGIDAISQLIDKMMKDNTQLVNQLSSLVYLQNFEEEYNELRHKNEYLINEVNKLTYEKKLLMNEIYQLQQEKYIDDQYNTNQINTQRENINDNGNGNGIGDNDNEDVSLIPQPIDTNTIINTDCNDLLTIESNPLSQLKLKMEALENKFKAIHNNNSTNNNNHNTHKADTIIITDYT